MIIRLFRKFLCFFEDRGDLFAAKKALRERNPKDEISLESFAKELGIDI